jgi:hypothetical protein
MAKQRLPGQLVLYKRQCFTMLSTIRLWYIYIYHMFRPDGIIFRYVLVYIITFLLLATLPTLASVYTLGVHGM